MSKAHVRDGMTKINDSIQNKFLQMKDLKVKKVEKTTLSKIYGGKVVSTHGSRNTIVNGTKVVEIMSDAFDDKDNDGKWDSNESGNICYSYL
jgi:hypothetical protein